MSSELPAGWPVVRLSQIAELSLGKMLDKNKNRGELRPYLANINVRWGGFDLRNLREMRFEEREIERYRLRSGDIVMCEGGEPGRCALWLEDEAGMMIQKALHRIRPMDGIDSHYLYFALAQKGSSGAFAEYLTGGGIKHLPGEKLAKVEVPIPPLDEQRRIAEVLRSVDETTARNSDVLAKAAEMLTLLSDELLVANAQRIGEPVRFGDLIETLEAGVSVNSEGRLTEPDEIGILKTSCVSAGLFEPEEHKAVLGSERARVRVPVRGDSIIISRMNTFELVGANAFVDADHADLYLPDRLWLLKTNSRVRVRWLAFYMKTAKFREQVVSIATGTSSSMKNISKARLNDLVVFIPDDQQQAQDIAALSAVETVLLTARKSDDHQQVAAVALKSDLLSGRVRVPA